MNCDRIAPFYRWIEYAAFGRVLERMRCAWLGELRGCERVLVLGEGDGRTLARMAEESPQARFVVVDASAGCGAGCMRGHGYGRCTGSLAR